MYLFHTSIYVITKTMGSCISKCSRKRKWHDKECHDLVRDKIVIAQAPISPISIHSTKQPLSPTSISSSVSSFSCTNTSPSTASYSLAFSSSSSSCLLSEERSFSNEFLKSCVKENPHIVHNHMESSFVQCLIRELVQVQNLHVIFHLNDKRASGERLRGKVPLIPSPNLSHDLLLPLGDF